MKAYGDASFLASLYTPDANSAAAAEAMGHTQTVFLLTPFGEIGLANALECGALLQARHAAGEPILEYNGCIGVYLLTCIGVIWKKQSVGTSRSRRRPT